MDGAAFPAAALAAWWHGATGVGAAHGGGRASRNLFLRKYTVSISGLSLLLFSPRLGDGKATGNYDMVNSPAP